MDQQQQKQLKVFGYGLPLILAALGLRHGFKHGWDPLSWVLISLAVLVLVITIFNRPLLVKIFKAWMKIAHFIGTVVTGGILIFLFYAIFTPVAIILRLAGKDYMSRRVDKQASSYWIQRNNDEGKEYTKQF